MSLLGRDLVDRGAARAGTPGRPATQAGPTVLVRASDRRVAESLAHLLAADGLTVLSGDVDALTAEVVVAELGPGRSAEGRDLLGGVPASVPLVVIGSDRSVSRPAETSAATVRLDPDEAPDVLPAVVRSLAHRGDRAPRAGTGWWGLALLATAVFVGPWTVWFSRIAEGRGLISWHVPQGLALWSILPVLVGAVALSSGRSGLRDLGSRLVRVRVPWWTFLLALAAPVAIAAASAVVVALSGGRVPVGELMSLPAALAYLGYGTGLFLLTEEAAWRGVLLPRLAGRVGAVAATLLVGLLWAVWHLPLLAVPGAADAGLPPAGFVVLVIGTGVLVGALVQVARGSVVVAAVFHASFDASYSWFGVVGEDHAMLWVATTLTTLVAGALLGLPRLRRRWAGAAPSSPAGRRRHLVAEVPTPPLAPRDQVR